MKRAILVSLSLLMALTVVAVLGCGAAKPATYSSEGSVDDSSIRHSLGLDTPSPEITLTIPPMSPAVSSPLGGSSGTAPQTYPPPPIVVTSAPNSGTKSSGSTGGGSNSYSSAADTRMIVRTGNLSMVVDDISTSLDKIAQLAADLGGWVVSSSKYGTGKTVSASISFRVPEPAFSGAMDSLLGMAVEVTSDNTSGQDVSEEYSDLNARLKNLEAAEAQLVVIMGKAEKVEDVLAVQRELTNVRSDIEVTKGRMQYLEQTSSTSLISVQLTEATLDIELVAGTRVARTGDTIGFSVRINGGIAPFSYKWDFGDGKTSVDAAPFHTYNSAKSYSVSVTVTDDRGNTATVTREDYISVLPGWSPGDVGKSAWRGFLGFGRFLYSAVIWLGIFSPVWIIGGGIVFLVVRRKRKKAVAKKAASQQTL